MLPDEATLRDVMGECEASIRFLRDHPEAIPAYLRVADDEAIDPDAPARPLAPITGD